MNQSPPLSLSAPTFCTRWLPPLLLICLGVGVYANAVGTALVFDDKKYVLENEALRDIFAPTRHLPPYPQTGYLDDSSRPVLFFTLAVNYALGKIQPAGYKIGNIIIHLAAALALYGILRRIFSLPILRRRFAAHAQALALIIASIWVVHPLNTMAVTYVWQRCESLMGMFYLFTLYFFIRGATSQRGLGWFIAAVLSCFLGMGTKETMLSAPIFVLCFDRALLAGTFRAALAARWRVHAWLFASLGFLAWVSMNTGNFYTDPARGTKTLADSLQYLATSPSAICYYLLRSVWPYPLCLDHHWPLAVAVPEVLPYIVPVVCGFAATVWALVKCPVWSLPGLFFFLVLAPTTSFMPLADPVCDYRLYLPLISILSAGICALYLWFTRKTAQTATALVTANVSLRRGSVIVAGLVVLGFGFLTVERNSDYQSDVTIWRDVVRQYPEGWRGRYNLAIALQAEGRFAEAQTQFSAVVQLAPRNFVNLLGMGKNLGKLNRLTEAAEVYRLVTVMLPDNGLATYLLGETLMRMGKTRKALPLLERAVQLRPDDVKAYNQLGLCWFRLKNLNKAGAAFLAGIKADPKMPDPHCNLGTVYAINGKLNLAIEQFKIAVKLLPTYTLAWLNLGIADESTGQSAKAVDAYRRVLSIEPGHVEAKNRLAGLLGK